MVFPWGDPLDTSVLARTERHRAPCLRVSAGLRVVLLAHPAPGRESLFLPAGPVDAAEPSTPFHGDTAHSTGCAQHQAVQDRLEILEETVEKTVEHLETEMKDLLGMLEGLAWTLPPALASTPDLLGGNGQLRPLFSTGKEEGLGTGK